VNVSSCYEAAGAFAYGTLKAKSNPDAPGRTASDVMTDLERSSCPGAGACGGMYTANTMATAIEAMGLTLPGSSSYPALSPGKARECERAAEVIKTTMEKDIRPRDLLTRESFENALVITMILGGSTNGVLHFLAMANTAEVKLTLEDVDRVSNKTPFLADLAPSGKYLMEDLYKIGGTPSVLKMLIAAGLINGNIPTVTGKTLAENVANWPSLPQDQAIIRPLSNPIKESGHIRVLRGNFAPDGAVAKITGKEGLSFTGKARVFNKEHELDTALSKGEIPRNESLVLIVRYEGPKGGPGMPEQLKASAAIIGAGLKNIALVTDGRYSGASHGFIVSLSFVFFPLESYPVVINLDILRKNRLDTSRLKLRSEGPLPWLRMVILSSLTPLKIALISRMLLMTSWRREGRIGNLPSPRCEGVLWRSTLGLWATLAMAL